MPKVDKALLEQLYAFVQHHMEPHPGHVCGSPSAECGGECVDHARDCDLLAGLRKAMGLSKPVEGPFGSGETLLRMGYQKQADGKVEVFFPGHRVPSRSLFVTGEVFNEAMDKVGELPPFNSVRPIMLGMKCNCKNPMVRMGGNGGVCTICERPV